MNNIFNAADAEIIMINLRICTYFFISVILLLAAYYMSRKPNTTKIRKEHKGVISPILAEVLIDGKIDIKNLILTTIVELQIKKNVAIVNDETIELLHKNDLKTYELFLVDMIFQNKKNVTFNEINDRFVYAKSYETNFIDSMANISDEIQSRLYEMKLFSRKKMIILNLVVYLALLLAINLPSLLLKAGFTQHSGYAFFTIGISVVVSILYFSRFFIKNGISDMLRNEFGQSRLLSVIIVLVCLAIVLIFSILIKIKFNMFSILGIVGIYVATLKTFKLAKNNVLSDKGLQESRKILELKNFLQNYDLRKKEGQETYIIWDEYFAYAAAFGISNPVISDIFKRWNKLDITLWFTDNLI